MKAWFITSLKENRYKRLKPAWLILEAAARPAEPLINLSSPFHTLHIKLQFSSVIQSLS